MKEGLEYFSSQEYDKAIKAFTTAITFDPNLANAYNNRGNAYEKKNNHGPRRNHWFYS
ncbi:MAG: tetratricopeptide repeat protein [Proteobacteria bacterium]|nr:tetratricopeptide repeat protein [Pseudomonadota bacterium]